MERFRSLLYLERRPRGCGRAFACALEVARTQGAALTVAALGAECETDDLDFVAPGGAQRLEALRRRCRAHLETLASRAAAHGIRASIRILTGSLPDAVADEVQRGDHDLFMKVADAGRRRPWWRFDTPDARLLRAVPCPVWLLDPAQRAPFRMVLAAVDVGDGRPDDLNHRILTAASSVANRSPARLHVIHTWSLLGEPVLADPLVGVSRHRLEGILQRTRRERRRKMEGLLADVLGDQQVTVELRKGSAGRHIRRSARRTEADVVVLGSARRTGLHRLVFGNLAEKLLGRVPSSLLVIPEQSAPRGASGPEATSRRSA